MINKKIDALFEAITNSLEYQNYIKTKKLIEQDNEIKILIDNIKKLQKLSVQLENDNDSRFLDVDKEIKEKISLLMKKPIYRQYLQFMDELNDILAESSHQIEKYIEEKV